MAVVQLVLDYYFQRVSIAPQDVSQDLFKVNLTAIISNLTDPTLASIVAAVSTSGGQALLSTASASDEAAINALSGRITSLSNNLTTLDNQILVRPQARGCTLWCVRHDCHSCSPACKQGFLHLTPHVMFIAPAAGQQLCRHFDRRPEPDLLLNYQWVVEPVAGLDHHWGCGSVPGNSLFNQGRDRHPSAWQQPPLYAA